MNWIDFELLEIAYFQNTRKYGAKPYCKIVERFHFFCVCANLRPCLLQIHYLGNSAAAKWGDGVLYEFFDRCDKFFENNS